MLSLNNQAPGQSVRRLAGQSLRDQKDWLLENRLIPFWFATAVLWILWAFETFQAYTAQPPQPTLFLSLAIVTTGVGAIAFGRLRERFQNLTRGERGELRVAEALEELRPMGYRAFHDLRGDGYNIDHVVIGPAGVFAVETKFRSGYGEIEFRNGEGLFVGGRKEDNDPLRQARGNAKAVSEAIKANCSVYQWVQPLVVFVGDWKIKNRWVQTDARVLTVDKLCSFFDQRQPELTRAEINLIASHLERSARS